MSQNRAILNYLSKGNTLTAKQARKAGVKNLRARVDDLRKAGFPVYNNGGQYRLGTPTRQMIKTAYETLGGSAFRG